MRNGDAAFSYGASFIHFTLKERGVCIPSGTAGI